MTYSERSIIHIVHKDYCVSYFVNTLASTLKKDLGKVPDDAYLYDVEDPGTGTVTLIFRKDNTVSLAEITQGFE
jgi:hypothetical protein